MQTNFQCATEVDEQAPASRRISAYRRCKEMNPRWMLENRTSQPLPGAPSRAEGDSARSTLSRLFSPPPLH